MLSYYQGHHNIFFWKLMCLCVYISDVLDENQSKLSEDLMEFRRDASMLNVSVCEFELGSESTRAGACRLEWIIDC